MATTEILPFAEGVGANVLTQAQYAALTAILANGFTAGTAQSNILNKVWRQSSFMSAGLANWMVNRGITVADDGNLAALVAEIEAALHAYLDKSVAGAVDITLNPLTEANYPIIDLIGAVTANINVIVPTAPGKWIFNNSSTGAFTITVKTAAGTGISVPQGSAIELYSDGVNVYSLSNVTQIGYQQELYASSNAGGTGDALTATFNPTVTTTTLASGAASFSVRAATANLTATPTFQADATTARTIVKGNNLPLVAGDIAGAGHWLRLKYDATLLAYVLQNPANGVAVVAGASIQGALKNLQASATGLSASVSVTVDEIAVENGSNAYQTLRAVSLVSALTVSGVNGLDNSIPQAVTISIATPGVITQNNHGFHANAAVVLATTGALPTGLTSGTTYYVTNPTINTYQLSATQGGVEINTSGTQSGVQTVASVLAVSAWYSQWVIWNGTTASGMLSSSATNPILPAGYTHKARVGWIRTDGTANKYPLSFKQYGRRARYVVVAGSNVTNMLQLGSGSTAASWVAIGVGNFVPPTASAIAVTILGGVGINTYTLAAPNNSYPAPSNPAGSGTAYPIMSSAGAVASSVHSGISDLFLESENIYWSSNSSASGGIWCLGWEDNL